jgi:hypothetical protein
MGNKEKQTMKHAWSILQPFVCSLLFAAFCLLPAAKQKMHPIARFPAALATLQTLRLPKGPSFQARPQQWGSCNYTIDKWVAVQHELL